MYKANTKEYTIENARHELQFMDDEEIRKYISFIRTWNVTTKNKQIYEAWITLAEEIGA